MSETASTSEMQVATVSTAETLPSAELYTTRPVIDQAGFERTQFDVKAPGGDSPFTIEFRSREELPITEDPNALHVVLAHDVRPQHTMLDEYGSWVEDRTGAGLTESGTVLDRPTTATIEQQTETIYGEAARAGSERVVLHVPATIEGLIDTALQLIAQDIGDRSRMQELLHLRETLVTQPIPQLDDRIMKLAMSASSRETGLMLGALDLAGVAGATQEANELVRDFDHRNAVSNLGQRVVDKIGAEGYMIPGQKVPAEKIDEVREAGLVAVHTTPSRPQHNAILSTSGHTEGTVPRDTVHWSMNHAVNNVLAVGGGNFAERPYTIVAPLAGLLEQNGAPVSMADVDTYFLADAENEVKLPEDTIIIEVGTGLDAPETIVQPDGHWALDPSRLQSTDGVALLADELAQLSKGDSGYNRDNISKMAYELSRYGDIDLETSLYQARQRVESGFAAAAEGQEYDTDEYATQRAADKQNLADLEAMAALLPEGQKFDNGAINQLLRNNEILAGNVYFQRLLKEGTRKLLVTAAIRNSGGKDFPKGGMHYTTGAGNFQEKNNAIADTLGVPASLHGNNADSQLEQIIGGLKQKVETRMTLPDQTTTRIEFDWRKLDAGALMYQMSRASMPQRLRAQATGLLTYAKPPRPVSEHSEEFAFG